MVRKVVVAGAGTMGSGIALSFAMKGFNVLLFDTFPNMLDKARTSIHSNLDFLVSKQKITQNEKEAAASLLKYSDKPEDCTAGLVIEAIIENEEAKVQLFRSLTGINNEQCIFASNTSSLSITAIQKNIPHPQRFAGLHFFNPAHVMRLVEVIKGEQTSDAVIAELTQICTKLGKAPVTCIDSPGFIVNRVARHYYLEAMRIAENNIAGFHAIDEVMEATGFKMGPFRLMDMIGMDVNLAVSQSLYDAFKKERFKPSPLQIEKVSKGNLGRKTGAGFYDYEKK